MTEDPSRPQPPPLPEYDPQAPPSEHQDTRPAPQPGPGPAQLDPGVREVALKRLADKKDFQQHLTIYGLVMTLLVVIWLLTGGWGEYFWPIWPMLGWGLAVAIHAGSVYFEHQHPTEEQIAREAEKVRRQQRRDELGG